MSIVGSIGVVGGGFGFDHLLGRYGVDRRLYTAGANKARLDPFLPERPEDVAFVQALMADIPRPLQGVGAGAAGHPALRRPGGFRRQLLPGRAWAGTRPRRRPDLGRRAGPHPGRRAGAGRGATGRSDGSVWRACPACLLEAAVTIAEERQLTFR